MTSQSSPSASSLNQCEVILGNANRRFSGVTSTMLQTLVYQRKLMNLCVLGAHHLSDTTLAVGFFSLARRLKAPLADGRWRVFHARRNDEMIQALILKYGFSAKIKIVFTSTAQRQHTRFTRWLMSKMDAVISTCDAAASYLPNPPAAIIPHGVRTDEYYPTDDKQAELQQLGIHTPYAIGIFGRVREQKGVHHFVTACIQALPKHPEYSAIIVGSITAENRQLVGSLEQKIQAAGLEGRIQFLGEQPFEKIPELFRAMTLVAALSRNEGFGLTVLEAMSSGAAVLATEAGAWPEVVREGTDGHIVPVDDGPAIGERLEAMLANPEKLNEMGRAGRVRVLEHYTVEREAKQLCDFYRSMQ